jgi:hypothetical protein
VADNTTPAPPRRRGPGRPFVKGQPSPNPGGRPKLVAAFQRALRERHYEKALEALLECLDDEDGRVRVAAVREVFDRMFGKPKQPLTGDVNEPIAVDLTAMLERLARG